MDDAGVEVAAGLDDRLIPRPPDLLLAVLREEPEDGFLEPRGVRCEVEREHRHRGEVEHKTDSRGHDPEHRSEDVRDPVVEVLVDERCPFVATSARAPTTDRDVERVLNPFDPVVQPVGAACADRSCEFGDGRDQDQDHHDRTNEPCEVDDAHSGPTTPPVSVRQPHDCGLESEAEEERHSDEGNEALRFADRPERREGDEHGEDDPPDDPGVDFDPHRLDALVLVPRCGVRVVCGVHGGTSEFGVQSTQRSVSDGALSATLQRLTSLEPGLW